MTEESTESSIDESKGNPLRWVGELPPLSSAVRKLLEDYSHIPAEQIESHVKKIREDAFVIHPYPCIGHFRFLDLGLHSSPIRDEVISRISGGQKYLDLGCCFGQEIRYLASQGCPSENLYGADLRPQFIEYGYELFGDKSTTKATFLTPADIFAEQPLSQLHGRIDIVNTSSFFHLFSWDDSITVGKRVVSLLRPVKGSLIIGRQVGRNGKAGPKTSDEFRASFRHNSDSWKEMWTKIGEATGSSWDVDFWWDETATARTVSSGTDDIQRFCFIVRRL